MKYSNTEVYKATLEYFNGDELATDVWMSKYALKDENLEFLEKTPNDMHKRLAKEYSRIEQKYENPLSYEEIYNLIKGFKYFVPAGSPMYGIGNNNSIVSLGNCYVTGYNMDSYGGIVMDDHDMVQLFKRRAGVGLDLSHLRPNESSVQNSAGTSTGAASFMERYSHSTKEVAQSGRRGALMLTIDIKHPDAENFIDAKLEQGKVTGANISVKVTNEFMKKVENNEDFIQTFPVDLDITHHTPFMEELFNDEIEYNKIYNLKYENDNEYKGCYAKRINAKELWNKIVKNAWQSAEPGVIFWDEITGNSPAASYGGEWVETSTNPCVSENTKILTDSGYIKIADKLNESVNVWNGQEFSSVIPQITGYNQSMFLITFSDGSELECTDYHTFYTWDGYVRNGNLIEKKAKQLKIGDKLEKYEFPILNRKHKSKNEKINLYPLGFFAGDGYYKREGTYLSLYGKKKHLIELFNIDGNIWHDDKNDKLTFKINLPELNIKNENLKKHVPSDVNRYSKYEVLTWISGLMDSDGSINSKEGSVSISSIDKDFLKKIKTDVLNTLGVNSHLIDEKPGGNKVIKDQEYYVNDSYRLVISAHNIIKLRELGLKTYRLNIDDIDVNRDAGRFIRIKNIQRINNADVVYCFKEDKRGRGCFNGVVTGQCGELPLPPYDSCRLSSLNLYSYVKNPYTKSAHFDFDLFEDHVKKAQRLMDDIVDLEEEKVDKILQKIDNDPESDKLKDLEWNIWVKIKNMLLNGRRTGLGVTGLGDMLAALNLQYSSSQSLELINIIFEKFGLNSYVSSIEMAKERGKFKEFNIEKEQFNPFIRNILEKLKTNYPDIWEMYYQYGRRNIANSTIAPTGSISILTQTTSGIEPAFMLYYKRRRKVDKDKSTKAVFKDNDGNWWEEYNVFHHKFVDWFKVTHWDRLSDKEKQEMNVKTPLEWLKSCSNELLEKYVQESPYYNATANEINYLNKVKMQGDIQKYIDHSISVTHNLPKDISKEEVSDIYFYAWKNNCKGVTIYRDGSREGVLVSDNEKNNDDNTFIDRDAIKRPKDLISDVYVVTVKGKKWIVSVGLLNNKPYEVFAFEKYENDINIKNGQRGIMTRVKRGQYKLCFDDENCIMNITDRMSDEEEALTRVISWGLRHGGGIKFVTEQLNKTQGDMTSFSKSIARTLKRYIKDGEKSGITCPNCGSDNVVYKDGCDSCLSCGLSNCS